jgi:hypothetical protein
MIDLQSSERRFTVSRKALPLNVLLDEHSGRLAARPHSHEFFLMTQPGVSHGQDMHFNESRPGSALSNS